MKYSIALAALAVALSASVARADIPPASQMSPEERAYVMKMEEIRTKQAPQSGDVALPQAHATLHLGENYYFLGPEDARRVLVEGWNNPPSSAEGVLGLVFPKGAIFYDPDAWGAVVTYQDSGYVSDEDARTTDYGDLLKQLQEGQEAANESRKEDGYPALHLMGWAQQPTYDARQHSVVWAQNLRSDGSSENGLNYDVRLLGRSGVLSLNMLSSMPHLASVNAAAAGLARAATFDAGSRYEEFVPDVDKKAGYGIAGLVAAGVGVAAAKKLGFLAILLGFGKKFIVLIGVAAVAVGRYVRRLFGREEEPDQE